MGVRALSTGSFVDIIIPGIPVDVRPKRSPKRGKEMSLSCGVCQENTLGFLEGEDSRAEYWAKHEFTSRMARAERGENSQRASACVGVYAVK